MGSTSSRNLIQMPLAGGVLAAGGPEPAPKRARTTIPVPSSVFTAEDVRRADALAARAQALGARAATAATAAEEAVAATMLQSLAAQRVQDEAAALEELHAIQGNQCPQCAYRADYPSDVRRHYTAKHMIYRPYVCGHPGCVKRFADKSNLLKHELDHAIVSVCPVPGCGAQLAPSNVRYHMSSHYYDYVCGVCGKTFKKPPYTHVRDMHPGQPTGNFQKVPKSAMPGTGPQ
jgi:DNA-directed RNA polymerase subunit RPC12/RpoP